MERKGAALVPYPAYNAGLKIGTYLPPIARPTYGKSDNERLYYTYQDELARQAAIKIFQDPMTQKMVISRIVDGMWKSHRKERESQKREDQFKTKLVAEMLSSLRSQANPAPTAASQRDYPAGYPYYPDMDKEFGW